MNDIESDAPTDGLPECEFDLRVGFGVRSAKQSPHGFANEGGDGVDDVEEVQQISAKRRASPAVGRRS